MEISLKGRSAIITGASKGLGLAMAYRISQAHHGTVEVVSTPGEGSRLDVLLPLRE